MPKCLFGGGAAFLGGLLGLLLPIQTLAQEMRSYTQEFEIIYSSAQAAQSATLKPLPVLDGKPWALSARWDDNHPGNLTMHDLMAKHGLKGTFYLTQTDEKNRFGSEYVATLLKGGFSIGGHSQSHGKLTEENTGDLFYDVLANRVEREAQANTPIVSFAFPFGLWTTPEDPQAIVRITETLRRSGFHHCTYNGFLRDNPALKPGEFSTSLLVMPGDHNVDAAKFDQNLQKIFKFSKAFQDVSYDVTLATHARQSGKAWDDLDKVFASLKKQADWWYCNQNEYAAYERQFRHAKIERISLNGAAARYRITRPIPAELGSDVPLTVELQGSALGIKGDDAPHEYHVVSGRTLANLAHDSRHSVPKLIDAIDNLGNAPASATLPQSRELAGLGAWLAISSDGSKATLSLFNGSSADVEDLQLTLRLPLAYQQGVIQLNPESLKPGERRDETIGLGRLSEDSASLAGRRYFVAEMDFRRAGQTCRLFATTQAEAARAQTSNPPPPSAAAVPNAGLVPFVIPADANPLFAFHGRAISTDAPRVTIRNGQFQGPDGRLRIWGVNLACGACFPSHKDAQRVAARLEAFGVNSVRFHHMDCDYNRFPKSIWDAEDPKRISAEALDRLDYFIDQLARRGIYSNLNLHVSRTHSRQLGLPQSRASGPYDKVVDLFTPELIEAQKDYARKLLGHVNKYRGKSYAQDPAVAFVEINNEDSFFMADAQEKLGQMDPYYASILKKLYNQWLSRRYGTREKLAIAWDSRTSGAGSLPPAAKLDNGWQVLTAEGAQASVVPSTDAKGMRVQIGRVGTAAWHLECCVDEIPLRSDWCYVLTFRARADAPRQVTVTAKQASSPWRSVGLRQNVELTSEWKSQRLEFCPLFDEPHARLSFLCGQNAAAFEVADVELAAVRPAGLADSEDANAGTVALEIPSESGKRAVDRLRFCAEIEKAYYDQMRDYLRNDLRCGALLTGTCVYGPLGLWAQSQMDYVDSHSYWAHPQFPGTGWNAESWNIDQASVADGILRHTLLQNAALRLAGKPFTVSEYNHAAPNDYQSEAIPTIAAVAAAQDWDGVWLFSYSGTEDDWDAGFFRNHFEIQANPSKWAFMPAGAAIFRDGGFRPLEQGNVWAISKGTDPLDSLAGLQIRHRLSALDGLAEMYGFATETILKSRCAVSFGGPNAELPRLSESPTTIFSSPGCLTISGYSGTVRMQSANAPAGTGDPGTLTVVSLDHRSLDKSISALILACGRCENTGMQFSADRRTVGNRWGAAPVMIQPLNLTITWPAEQVEVTALSPAGTPARALQLTKDATGRTIIDLSSDNRTIWYYVQKPR